MHAADPEAFAGKRAERNLALRLVVDSEAGLRGVDMAFHAAAARHRRGLLVGGDEGRADGRDAV